MSKNILFAFLFLMGAIPSIAQKNYQVQSPNRDIKEEVTVADNFRYRTGSFGGDEFCRIYDFTRR